MKKTGILFLLSCCGFILRAQDNFYVGPASFCNLCKRVEPPDSLIQRNIWSIGFGSHWKTIKKSYSHYDNWDWLPTDSSDLIFRNGFMSTSQWSVSAGASLIDKRMNIYSLSVGINPIFKRPSRVGPYSTTEFEGRYFFAEFAYGRPVMQKMIKKNMFALCYAFQTKFIYSSNKYEHIGNLPNIYHRTSDDESYIFLFSFSPTLRKSSGRLTMSISYDMVLVGYVNTHHISHIWDEPMLHDPVVTDISDKRNDFLTPNELIHNKLMFHSFNFGVSYSLSQNSNVVMNYKSDSSTYQRKNLLRINTNGGSVIGASFGYYRIFGVRKNHFFEGGIGLGYSKLFSDFIYEPSIIYYEDRIGFGVGYTGSFGILIKNDSPDCFYPIVSYRFDPRNTRFVCRMNLTPLIVKSRVFTDKQFKVWMLFGFQFGFRV